MTKGALLARWSAPPGGPESRPRYVLRRVLRHAYWIRTEGWGRVVEEDRLDPRDRARIALAKRSWRSRNPRLAGQARPVYVVGLQRSGTNMLMRGFDEAPEIEVRNENDRRVFERFQLKSDQTLVTAVIESRHDLVLVKPLCDSQRVAQLLDLPTLRPGWAFWVYRDPMDRARSEVSKFGESNLHALREIAAGRGQEIWQGERLGPAALALVQGFDLDAMTPHTAAVLFWVVRNQLFFELELDRRGDVFLVSYERFVADPEAVTRHMCSVIGFPFRPQLCAHVERRESHGRTPLDIDPAVRDLAVALTHRLDATRVAQERT